MQVYRGCNQTPSVNRDSKEPEIKKKPNSQVPVVLQRLGTLMKLLRRPMGRQQESDMVSKKSLPIPSISKMLTHANISEDIQPTDVLTPPNEKECHEEDQDAGEEHKVQMKILKLKLLQEEKILKQDKMKTEILKLQI
ncbi:Uncharacterized protein FWK35_00009043 [Aphis craccivora]|uniref:Uncharacterized protein n=1 Tax=Aphis craccivora TaxID=307492 RepID=A0A6G0ZBZ5_APHCR|nr:Uncharacterized protein FWK35_00009043 [Aphis craccivora]